MFALEGLAPVDGWVIAAIAAKALWYGATLVAIGGVLFVLLFERDDRPLADLVRRIVVYSAAAMLAILALGFGIQSARISGMGVQGMVEPMMLGFVWESPLGNLALWQIVGAILVAFILARNFFAQILAAFGAVAIALSFTQIGHSLGEPRWALASLLALHILAVSYWIGALFPLYRAAGSSSGAALLHRFGTLAVWIVGGLVAAGVTYAWLVSGSVSALFGTAYGWVLIGKVCFVSGLLALAAVNKLRLVPDLDNDRFGASQSLRRSISVEAAIVGLILVVTSSLTTITTPPLNL